VTADPSRREFLAASAAGLVALARDSASPITREEARVDGEILYVGTYTDDGRSKGIYTVRMDPRTGKLRVVGSTDGGANPSFLAIHPNGRVLYAVNEVEKYKGQASGAVSSFAIADSGALSQRSQQATGGGAPCFVSVDRSGRVVLVANYSGGSITLLPVEASGALGPAAQVVQHTGTGPNAERQEAPHAHCIVADPTNRFALAADLGADKVFSYRLDLDSKSLHHVEGGDAAARPGAGPRDIAFHPTLPLAFVANELDSTVSTLRFDSDHGVLTPAGVYSTLPSGWSGTNYPADIHVVSSGQTLYVSNRGHNSIAVFSIALSTGALTLEQVISTEGDWPRHFALDPGGRFLLIANQKSGSVVVLGRDRQTGRLSPTRVRIDLPSPACLRFRSLGE
jgi:6-phosphogluconolactonase